jgi:predicted GNAT family acetyltransferase
MGADVRDNPERSRYELVVDGEVIGFADYDVDGDVVVMPHTEIAPNRRHQGFGAILVQGALDAIRASGRRVVARCWYVADFIDHHGDYADLVA